MRKYLLVIVLSLVIAPLAYANLENKLSGKILLAVEDKGQAWYVRTDSAERAYLGRPKDAFRIMRELGLGISEVDFARYEEVAPSSLSGKILLRVEASGEAYYVNPDNLKPYYLGRPADAFRVMRELGLGISSTDLETITVSVDYPEEIQAGLYKNLVTLYFFHGDGCPHCTKEEAFLEKLKDEYDNLVIKKFEVWKNQSNKEFLDEVKSRNNYFANGVPFTVIGAETVLGFGEESTTGEKIRQIIDRQSEEGSTDTVFPVYGDTYFVENVVDGDTIDVQIDGESRRIRIIGMDTPEVVDPRQVLECFGPEASKRAKEILNGQYVKLEADETQDEEDKYGRLLRHIKLANGENFAEIMIREGVATEYTYKVASKYQKEYQLAEADAKLERVGMWADDACDNFVPEEDRVVVNSNSELEIVEIFYDGVEGELEPDEYVLIRNNGPIINLENYKLSDKSWKQYTFKDFYLAEGASVKLYTGCGEDMSTALYWCYTSSAIWNNTGDEASLFNPDGELMASYSY